MAMVLEPKDVRVEIAEGDEIEEAIQRELDEIGMTFEELRDQAESDDFASERARIVWFIISPLEPQG